MFNVTDQETKSCGCDTAFPEDHHVSTLDPRVSESVRQLDRLSDQHGDRMAEAITMGAIGRGPLAAQFKSVGEGADAALRSQPGDILIARGLFADSDPRVDIVGFDPSLSRENLLESFENEAQIEVYRPTGNMAENPLAGVASALGIASSLKSLAPSPLGFAQNVLSTLNSAADLRLKYEEIRQINERNRLPSFVSPVVKLIDSNFRTGREQTSVYRFSVVGKRRGTIYDSADYTASFDVTVLHDCINILEARVTSRNSEARGSVLPYTMSVNITKSTHSGHRLPAVGRMHIAVTWNPDRGSDLFGGSDTSYRATAELHIRADGRVSIIPGSRSSDVRITSARAIRRGGSQCAALYQQIRDKSRGPGNQAPLPLPPTPQTPPSSGGGGRPSRPSSRPSSRPPRSVIPGPPTAVRPHPQNGRNIFFGFRSSNPQGYALQEVRSWWNGLSHAIRASIISGQRALYVTGHADYTGRDRFNVSLSRRRAEAVAAIIQQVSGQRIAMRIDGKGWRSARDAGQRPGQRNQNWRRVTISLDNPG